LITSLLVTTSRSKFFQLASRRLKILVKISSTQLPNVTSTLVTNARLFSLMLLEFALRESQFAEIEVMLIIKSN